MRLRGLLLQACTLGLGPFQAGAQAAPAAGRFVPSETPIVEGQGALQTEGIPVSGNAAGNAVEPLSKTLENGLRVVVLEDPTPGLVAVQTWISVGSGSEAAPGSTGYAHFFEHLMFHGTPSLSGDAREARLVALGVEENAWTSQDETCYHLLGPVGHLEDLLEIEADRFAHLHLTDPGVRREAGAVYGEFRKSEADPFNALWVRLWSTAFVVHPYKHSTLGLEADIQAMPDGLERALDFRSIHYRPDNALLMVAGDIDPAQTMEMVERTFGRWTATGPGPGPIPAEPEQKKERRSHIEWTGPTIDPKLAVGWRVPAFAPGSSESAALDVVRELLMARASKLVRKLVDEDGLAFSVWSEAPDRVAPGLLAMFVDLHSDADPDVVLAAVDDAVQELESVSEGRVVSARSRIQRKMQIALTGPEERAQVLGRMALHGEAVTAHWDHIRAVGRVDTEAVKRVVRTLLVPQGRVVVTLSGGKN